MICFYILSISHTLWIVNEKAVMQAYGDFVHKFKKVLTICEQHAIIL